MPAYILCFPVPPHRPEERSVHVITVSSHGQVVTNALCGLGVNRKRSFLPTLAHHAQRIIADRKFKRPFTPPGPPRAPLPPARGRPRRRFARAPASKPPDSGTRWARRASHTGGGRQSARYAAARSAPPRRAGAAVLLAAAAGPGAHAQGRQAAPLRIALKQLPALAARRPLARWGGAVAGTAQAGARRLCRTEAVGQRETCLVPVGWCAGGVRCRHALRALRPPLASTLSAAKGVRPSASPPSPPGERQGVGPARRLARPTRLAAPLSSACQRSADETSRWVAIPALRGCQPIAGDHGGSAPKPPGAAVPRGSAWVGRCKDSTAARSKTGALCGAPSHCRTRWSTTVPRPGRT